MIPKLYLILLFLMPFAASANERFIKRCETKLSKDESTWLRQRFKTNSCAEISEKISRLDSFEGILPRVSHRLTRVSKWLQLDFANNPELRKDYLEDRKVKSVLFGNLDLFVGFTNLIHIDLNDRNNGSACDVIRKFSHLKYLHLDRKDFYKAGVDDCLADSSISGVYLRNTLLLQGQSHAPIVRTKTRVLGLEYWDGPFAPIRLMPRLEVLHYSSKRAGAGIELLGGNLFLQKLDIEAEVFPNIRGISVLKELRNLSITATGDENGKLLSDISFVRGLTWLRYLDLRNNAITDLRPIESLPELYNADFSGNKISILPDFNKTPYLREINLSHNNMTSFEIPSETDSISILDLSSNAISDYSSLQNLRYLRALNISANKPLETMTLPPLPKLEILQLDGFSGIYKDSRGWETHDKVYSLLPEHSSPYIFYFQNTVYGNDCRITPTLKHLDMLRGFDSLQALYLRNQNLTSIPDLTGLPKLRFLNLFGNKIQDFPDEGHPTLKVVNLTDNEGYSPSSVIAGVEIIRDEKIEKTLKCQVTDRIQTGPYPPL